jgi:integrase
MVHPAALQLRPTIGTRVVAAPTAPKSTTLKCRIGLREIKSLCLGEIAWDMAVVGFFARRQRSEAITYGVRYRPKAGEQRWARIGRHGSPWTPDAARAEAKRILGEVASGGDPGRAKQTNRRELTVAELCEEYLAQVEAGRILTRRGSTKQASTVATDRSRIAAHISPLLGSRKVSSVTTDDVEAFMHDVIRGKASRHQKLGKRAVSNVRGGRGAAARTIGLLGAIFSYAVRSKIRGDNPVRGVIRPAMASDTGELSTDEYAKWGAALASSNAAIAACRFLAITGWRTGEVLGLRWGELDLHARTAHLRHTKTGASIRPLSNEAVSLLLAQGKCVSDTNSATLIFPSTCSSAIMAGFPRIFGRIVKASGLTSDVTPHVLRHSFASLAADLGYSEPTIAALLGHKGGGITRRYIHSADSVLLAAADGVASEVSKLLSSRGERP